jgi:hypothetical protein
LHLNLFTVTLYTNMRIIIAGGTGLIGRGLGENLAKDGHEVVILSRSPEKVTGLAHGVATVAWDGLSATGWGKLADGTDVVVNFAGENLKGNGLLPRRWTKARKNLIRQSRLDAGRAVTEAIRLAGKKPKLLVQASAVGYYGPHGDDIVSEQTPPGADFLANLCKDWENSTADVEQLGVRRVVLRTGLPLTLKGGAFSSLILPFRFFAGNTFGSGDQYYPWIHFEDCVAAIRFLIDDPESSGAFNLSAPNPVTNREFAHTLGRVMHRPAFFPIPRFAVELPFGEVATVVMDGQRAIPAKLQKAGFEFHFTDLEPALKEIIQ